MLQTLLGHRSIKTTEIYANWVRKEELERWVYVPHPTISNNIISLRIITVVWGLDYLTIYPEQSEGLNLNPPLQFFPPKSANIPAYVYVKYPYIHAHALSRTHGTFHPGASRRITGGSCI